MDMGIYNKDKRTYNEERIVSSINSARKTEPNTYKSNKLDQYPISYKKLTQNGLKTPM